jgi:hypothetical protein
LRQLLLLLGQARLLVVVLVYFVALHAPILHQFAPIAQLLTATAHLEDHLLDASEAALLAHLCNTLLSLPAAVTEGDYASYSFSFRFERIFALCFVDESICHSVTLTRSASATCVLHGF